MSGAVHGLLILLFILLSELILFTLQAFSDLLDVVSRRMGFIPLPLGVLIVRVLGPFMTPIYLIDYVLLLLLFLW